MFIELSYVLHEEMPIYPGTPQEAFIPHSRIDNNDPNNTTTVKHFLHNGTHVDAPYHFDNNGKSIDEVPIEDFFYSRIEIIEVPCGKGELITKEHIRGHDALKSADLLLIYTGYSKYMEDIQFYIDDFPALKLDAALLLRNEFHNLKAVGIDTMSIESVYGVENDFKVHRTLLSKEHYNTPPILVYENVYLETLLTHRREIKRVYGFPIRFAGADAAPVALIAEI